MSIDGHLDPHDLSEMPGSLEELAQRGQEQSRLAQHLEQCEECMRLVRTIWRLRELRSPGNSDSELLTSSCSEVSEWLELTAGLREEDKEVMLAHATRCTRCACMLKEAAELTCDQAAEVNTSDGDPQLKSSTAAWQRRMAAKMTNVARFSNARELPPISSSRILHWTPRYVSITLAIAFLFLCVSSYIYFLPRRQNLDRTNELIAEAYTERRTLTLRIPGVRFGPLRIERGIGDSSYRPLALLEAETQIASRRKKEYENTEWAIAEAYTNVLEGEYDRAVHILEPKASTEYRNADFDLALAIAYFGRGVKNGSPDDIGNARESIGKAYDRNPKDAVVLFNQALIDQELSLYSQAKSEWGKYLEIDASTEWAIEARKHLADCEEMIHRKERLTDGRSLLTPESISGFTDRSMVKKEISRRIEDYQLQAFTLYYPSLIDAQISQTGDAQLWMSVLQEIAKSAELEHHDRHLVDLLGAKDLAHARAPSRKLVEAIRANRRGDEERAIAVASEAAKEFERIGNRAGALRARFEIVYALQFLSRSAECTVSAWKLAEDARHLGYSWLAAESETEAGFCETMEGKFREAFDDLSRAERLARESRYDTALDRVRVGEAGLKWQTGSVTAAWDISLTGLREFWSSSVPLERGESFCDFLDEMSEEKEMWHLQSAVLKEAVSLLEHEEDHVAEAQVLVRLAGNQLTLQQPRSAKANFERALSIFRDAPQTSSTKSQEMMVRINFAKAEALNRDFAVSASDLEKLRPISVSCTRTSALWSSFQRWVNPTACSAITLRLPKRIRQQSTCSRPDSPH